MVKCALNGGTVIASDNGGKNMDKPITVVEREYKEQLVQLTNDAALPTFMKAAVVKELYEAIAKLDQEERAQAEKAWAEAQAAENEDKDG